MAAFQFDPLRLARLEQQVPSCLQLLRLRLRFGLPRTLRIGQRFRVSLELVDEMGQSVANVPASDLEVKISYESSSRASGPGVELNTRELFGTSRESCRWTFDAEFSLKAATSNQSQDDADHGGNEAVNEPMDVAIMLQVDLKARALAGKTEFHDVFQQFCCHSVWIDAQTLVLPVQTPSIRLLPRSSQSLEGTAQVPKPAVSLCSRVFSISCPLQAQRKAVTIQENYGDTMGSHIWDASILLAFALTTTSQFPLSGDRNHTMLELGAGCGLFAAVYAALCGEELEYARRTMVLTERRESLTLLEANMLLNSESLSTVDKVQRAPVIRFLPLVWGDPIDKKSLPVGGVDTIFAADVLYNWSAHEPLLRTIDAILQHKQQQAKANASSVVIAHKHRGSKAASSASLEQLIHDSCESSCEPKSIAKCPSSGECQWTHWHVSRAARLGKVDILLLARKT
ncbi:Nicotinamide n-methyltransferase [Globisporangium polare]